MISHILALPLYSPMWLTILSWLDSKHIMLCILHCQGHKQIGWSVGLVGWSRLLGMTGNLYYIMTTHCHLTFHLLLEYIYHTLIWYAEFAQCYRSCGKLTKHGNSHTICLWHNDNEYLAHYSILI